MNRIQIQIAIMVLLASLLSPQFSYGDSPIKLELGPVLLQSEVASIEIAFADLNADKKPDLIVGSQWHIWDKEASEIKRTKMSADGRPVSIHYNNSTKERIRLTAPLSDSAWPISNKDPLYRLPVG